MSENNIAVVDYDDDDVDDADLVTDSLLDMQMFSKNMMWT